MHENKGACAEKKAKKNNAACFKFEAANKVSRQCHKLGYLDGKRKHVVLQFTTHDLTLGTSP